jgi:hypothetical protein
MPDVSDFPWRRLILALPSLLVWSLISLFLALAYLQATDRQAFERTLLEGLGLRKVTWTVTLGNTNPGSISTPQSANGNVRIGFHTGPAANEDGLGNWMRALDSAGIPIILKSVDTAGPLFEAQQLAHASGVPHLLIYRDTTRDHPDYNLLPREAAAVHWQYHSGRWPPELDKNLVWFETINEVDKNRSEWLAEFAHETARLALRDGFKWAAFGFATGEPEPHHWQGPKMLQFLRFVSENPDRLAIALHEYSLDPSNIRAQENFLVGRFQDLYRTTDSNGISRPTVLITEWGWQADNLPNPGPAMEQISWANNLYAQYPSVKGAAIWYLGDRGNWGGIANKAQLLIAPLAQWSVGTLSEIPPTSYLSSSGQRFKPAVFDVLQQAADTSGFPTQVVIDNAEAANWINAKGADIDLGMMLAIIEGETNIGANLGNCSGVQGSRSQGASNTQSALWFLQHWQSFSVREWSTVSAMMIEPDYSDYISHCGAGAFGPDGILPRTGEVICRSVDFASHPDDRIKSCNFFEIRISAYAKAWLLHDNGYKSTSTDEEKFDVLYWWNRDVGFRNQLIRRSHEINATITDPPSNPPQGNQPPGGSGVTLYSITFWTYPVDTPQWKIAVVLFLRFMGLLGDLLVLPEGVLPDVPGALVPGSPQVPQDPGEPPVINPGDGLPIITEYRHPHPGGIVTQGMHGVHAGVDFGYNGNPSSPIYAMHDGRVTYVGYIQLWDPRSITWWVSGNTVALEGLTPEGNHIWTVYAHGTQDSFEVKEGDIVSAGDLLMMSGSTGRSTGVHLHLGMKLNGAWVNVLNYLP